MRESGLRQSGGGRGTIQANPGFLYDFYLNRVFSVGYGEGNPLTGMNMHSEMNNVDSKEYS
jgi:hypothetical protein